MQEFCARINSFGIFEVKAILKEENFARRNFRRQNFSSLEICHFLPTNIVTQYSTCEHFFQVFIFVFDQSSASTIRISVV